MASTEEFIMKDINEVLTNKRKYLQLKDWIYISICLKDTERYWKYVQNEMLHTNH